MLGGATLKKTSDALNINIATAFAWRHKILDILKNKKEPKLSRIVEADDTFLDDATGM